MPPPKPREIAKMTSVVSARLRLQRFGESDAEALAALLADSSITRNITANGSTPERCLAAARKRIAWYNDSWQRRGYGVWALRALDPGLAPADRLLGWCGFIPPDDEAPDPEILYAVDRDYRGKGIAAEAAACVIDWLFRETDRTGVTAVISTRLNSGSVAVVSKLGLTHRGRMDFSLFLSSSSLADEVAEYEIWRLAQGPADDLDTLVEQSAFRAGQLATVTSIAADDIRRSLSASLTERCDGEQNTAELARLQALLDRAFDAGAAEAYMDCYHISRESWFESVRA